MWTRKELKLRAKEVLRKNYWKAFLISIVIAVAQCQGGFSGGGGGKDSSAGTPAFDQIFENLSPIILLIIIIVALSSLS